MVDVKIYTLANPLNNEIFYVGRAVDLKTRLSGHINDRYSGKKKGKIIEEIISNGVRPIIEEVDSIQCKNAKDEVYANQIEEYWINQFLAWGFVLTNTGGIDRRYNILDTKIKWSYYDKEFGSLISLTKKLEYELHTIEKQEIPPERNTILGRKSWYFDIKKKRNELTKTTAVLNEKTDYYYKK